MDVKQLSSRELLLACGENLRDHRLWEEFYSRYRPKILTYLWRACRTSGGNSAVFLNSAEDWVQDVFTKLVQNDGRVIRSFRGESDLSVNAFLASIAITLMASRHRSERAVRRRAETVPIDESSEVLSAENPQSKISALLSLIDVEKALKKDEESKNPTRDFLIFKLHFIEGFTAREIASLSVFNLTPSGLEKVLNRLRNRLGPDK